MVVFNFLGIGIIAIGFACGIFAAEIQGVPHSQIPIIAGVVIFVLDSIARLVFIFRMRTVWAVLCPSYGGMLMFYPLAPTVVLLAILNMANVWPSYQKWAHINGGVWPHILTLSIGMVFFGALETLVNKRKGIVRTDRMFGDDDE